MDSYNNVKFIGKLPDEAEADFYLSQLARMKNLIDTKLQILRGGKHAKKTDSKNTAQINARAAVHFL